MNKFLLLILILGAILRLVLLDSYPSGLSGDEAGQGYSAYSILKTGRDEWGEFLPLFPRGFGDYKPPVYMYLSIPSIMIFGLNEYSVRLPAAIMGILSIWVIYLLVLQLSSDKRAGLLAAMLMAFSPWSVQLSRTASEGNPGILFFMLGLLMFLKGKSNTKLLFLGVIFWGLSIYSYHALRVFTVLMAVGLMIIERKQWSKKVLISIGLLLVLFLIPIGLNSAKAASRLNDVSITKELVSSSALDLRRFNSSTTPAGKIYDNKYVYLVDRVFGNYLSYFNLSFYFTGGRNASNYLNFPGTSLFYYFEIITIFGFIFLAIKKPRKQYLILLMWLIFAPIPASVTTDEANAIRGVMLMPVLIIMSAMGLNLILSYVKNAFKFRFLLIGFYTLAVSSFLFAYVWQVPKMQSQSIRFGYKQIFEQILNSDRKYEQIIISKSFSEPQIFIAFYSQMDPVEFQSYSKNWLVYEQKKLAFVDQLESYNLGKYQIKNFAWNDLLRSDNLLAGSADQFPDKVTTVVNIRDNQGKEYFKLVETRSNIDRKL